MALKASELLTPEQVQRLRVKSDVVGALLVLHAWALILGSMALFMWLPNPLTFALAVMVIGTRQLGLAILMHDAAHGLLFENRRLNEWVGTWLCAAPVFTSLQAYRPYHLTHHRHTQQAEDPDLGLSTPFPITRSSFWRKVVRDLTGRTAYQRRLEQFRGGLAREWRSFAVNLLLFGGLAGAGYWWLYPTLWLLPLATWYQLVSRLRNIAEHAMVPDNDNPLRNTRTTAAHFLERLLIAPYWVNYHLEHHLFLFVPCWRLPEAHRALVAAGLGPRMELQPGYFAVLRLATSRQGEAPRSPGGRRAAQHI
jgi:fatty acid desaturase